MREFVTMWKYRSMWMLFLFSVVLYVAVNIPFESGFIVFDMKDFQPLSSLPVVLGLFFGPAGVLGAGIGAFLVALYGGFSWMTPFMMLGNMLMALLAYRLWDKLFVQADVELLVPKSGKRLFVVNLFLVVIVSAMTKALVVSWGNVLLLEGVFYRRAIPLFINDALGGLLLSIIAIFLLFKRLRLWEMIWSDLMRPGDMGIDSRLGAWISLVSILFCFIISVLASFYGYGILVIIFGAVCILGIIVGLFWKGRHA